MDVVQAHFGVPDDRRKSLAPESRLIEAAKIDPAAIESCLQASARPLEPAR